jgi:hypothetical protein
LRAGFARQGGETEVSVLHTRSPLYCATGNVYRGVILSASARFSRPSRRTSIARRDRGPRHARCWRAGVGFGRCAKGARTLDRRVSRVARTPPPARWKPRPSGRGKAGQRNRGFSPCRLLSSRAQRGTPFVPTPLASVWRQTFAPVVWRGAPPPAMFRRKTFRRGTALAVPKESKPIVIPSGLQPARDLLFLWPLAKTPAVSFVRLLH